MDTKGSCESINECCCTSVSEKFVHCPFHSHQSLNSVSWLDLESAISSKVELKDILNTNVPIFSAEALLDLSILRSAVIPLVHLNDLAILDYRSRFSSRVSNPNCGSHCPTQTIEREFHFLRWRSSECYIINRPS